MNDSDGSMARLPQLREFSEKHGLKMVLISDLVRYRRKRQALVDGDLDVCDERRGDDG